jgi:hypothetical protein
MMETDGWNGPEWDTKAGTWAKVLFIPTLMLVIFTIGVIFS